MPGEPRIHSFALAKPVTLWASPANAGAQVLANEIATAFAGLTISTADARPANATHMLLYLNEDSFSDERLAEQVKQARQDKLKIVMAHENDPDLGGCEFSKFFETTPQVERRLQQVTPVPSPPSPKVLSFQRPAGAHRGRALQGPRALVLPRAPPRGARSPPRRLVGAHRPSRRAAQPSPA